MAGVTFSHPLVKPDLEIRLPPTEVQWSYNLNTAKFPTYAGEVVQVLSVSFDTLTITGQFGKEGSHGVHKVNGKYRRNPSESWNTPYIYGVGLLQMTAWFREYFSIASQGVDSNQNFDERPVDVKYQGGIQDVPVDYGKSEHLWKVYPTSFPSYRRSNQNFAPEWQVVCEVAEADPKIAHVERDKAIERIQRGARWQPMNKYSDPLARFIPDNFENATPAQRARMIKQAFERLQEESLERIDFFNEMIPLLSPDSFRELLTAGASAPVTGSKAIDMGTAKAK